MTERHYSVSETGSEFISPRWIVEPLADALDGFDLDPASGCEPVAYANHRITANDEPDGLNARWGEYAGDVYLNPPYAKKLNPIWADKVSRVLERGEIDTLTVLLPGSTSTNWYQDGYAGASVKTEIHSRISFDSPDDDDTNGASFASIIHSFGTFPAEYHRALHSLGQDHPDAPDKEIGTTVWTRETRW